MRKTIAVLLGLVCMVYIAACGSSSTATTTVYAVGPSVSVLNPYPLPLGGAVQGGAIQTRFSSAQHNTIVTTTYGGAAGFINISSAGAATFNRPIDVTTDGTNLYVADSFNNAIRQINIETHHVTTIGNANGFAGSVDTANGIPSFNRPNGITINIASDGNKSLYVTDSGNFSIRRIDLSNGNAVTTLAGSAGAAGSVDALGASARFNVLNGITTDSVNLYVTDSNNTIRMIRISDGNVTTLAGVPGTTGSADGTPPTPTSATLVRFNQPARLTTNGTNLYVTDFGNSTIRQIVLATGAVTTIAGQVGPGGTAGSEADSTDGTGQTARFNHPHGITCDGVNLYVTDSYDNKVRRIALTNTTDHSAGYSGPVTTLATIGTKEFNLPIGITTDGKSLFITNFTGDNSSHTIQQLQ